MHSTVLSFEMWAETSVWRDTGHYFKRRNLAFWYGRVGIQGDGDGGWRVECPKKLISLGELTFDPDYIFPSTRGPWLLNWLPLWPFIPVPLWLFQMASDAWLLPSHHLNAFTPTSILYPSALFYTKIEAKSILIPWNLLISKIRSGY